MNRIVSVGIMALVMSAATFAVAPAASATEKYVYTAPVAGQCEAVNGFILVTFRKTRVVQWRQPDGWTKPRKVRAGTQACRGPAPDCSNPAVICLGVALRAREA